MKRLVILASALIAAGCHSAPQKTANIIYPATKTVDSSDIFYGTNVPDPYRWLEDYSSADTKEWITTENKVTDQYFGQIPFRERIKKDLTSLINFSRITHPEKHGDYYYFDKN